MVYIQKIARALSREICVMCLSLKGNQPEIIYTFWKSIRGWEFFIGNLENSVKAHVSAQGNIFYYRVATSTSKDHMFQICFQLICYKSNFFLFFQRNFFPIENISLLQSVFNYLTETQHHLMIKHGGLWQLTFLQLSVHICKYIWIFFHKFQINFRKRKV